MTPANHYTLSFQRPFDWQSLLGFLGRRAIPGIEKVGEDHYRRTLACPSGNQEIPGWLNVTLEKDSSLLDVGLSSSLTGVANDILKRLRWLFDLDCQPDQVAARLGHLASPHPGLRIPGALDGFEIAVRAVLGQQISVAAARTLASRLAKQWGSPLPNAPEGLSHLFPGPTKLANITSHQLGELGVFRSRQRAIQALAEACACGKLTLTPDSPLEPTLALLESLPGIGEWTAQYIAMRALGWKDAFPATDHGVKKALGETSRRNLRQIGKQWRPYRAYATMHLWQAGESTQ